MNVLLFDIMEFWRSKLYCALKMNFIALKMCEEAEHSSVVDLKYGFQIDFNALNRWNGWLLIVDWRNVKYKLKIFKCIEIFVEEIRIVQNFRIRFGIIIIIFVNVVWLYSSKITYNHALNRPSGMRIIISNWVENFSACVHGIFLAWSRKVLDKQYKCNNLNSINNWFGWKFCNVATWNSVQLELQMWRIYTAYTIVIIIIIILKLLTFFKCVILNIPHCICIAYIWIAWNFLLLKAPFRQLLSAGGKSTIL